MTAEPTKEPLTADELERCGRELAAKGHLVVYLHPSEEWIAVKEQTPFLRNRNMP